MKNLVILLVVVLFSANAFATIKGTKHDFSSQGWGTTEICQPCHAPHGNLNASGETLWNHQATTATFTMYKAASHTNTAKYAQQPNEGSKKCLGCHDGTVALDSFGGTTGTHFMTTANGEAFVGTDLSNDHPISFVYPTTTSSSYNWTSTSSISGTYGTANTSYSLRLSNGYVECSTCHSAHNSANQANLLKMPNDGSQLCLACHIK